MSSKSETHKLNNQDGTDGPPPMRDYKPTKKHPNSADQFWQSHQAEYEARGAGPGDPAARTRRHNAAYPLLRDELERRRSLAKITTGKVIRMGRGRVACTCDACLKIKKKSFKKSRGKSSRIGNSYDGKRVKYNLRNSRNVLVNRDSLKQSVLDRVIFPTYKRYSNKFKNEPSSNVTKFSRAKKEILLRGENSAASTTTKKLRNKEKEKRVVLKPRTVKVTRKFPSDKSIKNGSSSRKLARIEKIDDGNDGDADSSLSEKFRSKEGSRAHSIATEPSVPSYSSSFSLGLENEPMVTIFKPKNT